MILGNARSTAIPLSHAFPDYSHETPRETATFSIVEAEVCIWSGGRCDFRPFERGSDSLGVVA